MIFVYVGLVLLAGLLVAFIRLLHTITSIRREFGDEAESVASSLRLMVAQGKRPRGNVGDDHSLTRWYFVTPDKRAAGRVGADMGEHLLVLWLTDEHGQRLNILRETFGQRGGLLQFPSARTGDWRFFSTLPALELAMGWAPTPPRGGRSSHNVVAPDADDPAQFTADE